jgi:NADH:ubiquinone oxidoreductase subunit 6 (subunit J)
MLLFDIFANFGVLNYIDNIVWVDLFMKQPNGLVIGALIYTFYMHWFLLAGFILLVAMIGAISLTLAHKEGLKRQNLYIQLIRRDK